MTLSINAIIGAEGGFKGAKVGLRSKEDIPGREPDREVCREVNCGDRLTKVGPLVKAYILNGKIPKTRNTTGWLDLHEKSMA